MKWPRGKYNDQRIVGFNVQIKMNVLHWRWMPVIENQHGPTAIHWLCFYSWWNANFESKRQSAIVNPIDRTD